MWPLLMTSDFSVSAKTMQMKVVQKVLDRMLMGYGIHLTPHIGGKPLIDVEGFLVFLVKYS